MNDYAPRLRAQQQQAADERAIIELEQHIMPLMLSVKVTLIGLALALAWNFVGGHIEHYLSLAADQEALVQCINGKAIFLGDDVLRCEVKQYQLVAGVKP